jgi:hypothetical protein
MPNYLSFGCVFSSILFSFYASWIWIRIHAAIECGSGSETLLYGTVIGLISYV